MTTSSVYKIVMDDNFKKPWDVLGDYIFTNWHNRKLDNFEHHHFQFQVWKKSMFSKFAVEGLFLTIYTILFQYYLMKAISNSNIVKETFDTYEHADPSKKDALFLVFEDNAAIFFQWMQITIYLAFISLCFPLKIVLNYAFSSKSKRIFKLITFSNILDISIFSLFLTRIIFEFEYYRRNLDPLASDGINGVYYFEIIYDERKDGEFLSYLYATGSALLWLRILIIFKLTRFLGPLVKMIESMLNNIVIFYGSLYYWAYNVCFCWLSIIWYCWSLQWIVRGNENIV